MFDFTHFISSSCIHFVQDLCSHIFNFIRHRKSWRGSNKVMVIRIPLIKRYVPILFYPMSSGLDTATNVHSHKCNIFLPISSPGHSCCYNHNRIIGIIKKTNHKTSVQQTIIPFIARRPLQWPCYQAPAGHCSGQKQQHSFKWCYWPSVHGNRPFCISTNQRRDIPLLWDQKRHIGAHGQFYVNFRKSGICYGGCEPRNVWQQP